MCPNPKLGLHNCRFLILGGNKSHTYSGRDKSQSPVILIGLIDNMRVYMARDQQVTSPRVRSRFLCNSKDGLAGRMVSGAGGR
jgi:hypothetical protein